MASLTDLSPRDMQEGAIRMGVNIAAYFLNDGRLPPFALGDKPATRPEPVGVSLEQLAGTATPLGVLADAAGWHTPEGWGDHVLPATVVAEPGTAGLAVTFDSGGKKFRGWYHQAVITQAWNTGLSRRSVVFLDVTSHLRGGARIAVAFQQADGNYHESAPVFIRPDVNRNVAFDLGTSRFKSADTDWRYTAHFPGDLAPDRLFLIVFPQQGSGRITIANLRVAER